jgi:hypothetical protein
VKKGKHIKSKESNDSVVNESRVDFSKPTNETDQMQVLTHETSLIESAFKSLDSNYGDSNQEASDQDLVGVTALGTSSDTSSTQEVAQHTAQRKPRNTKKTVLVVSISIVAFIVAAYIAFSITFIFRYPFNTTIGDVNVSFKTPEEAYSLISEQVDGYNLQIVKRDATPEYLRGKNFDLKLVDDGKLKKYLKEKNSFTWPVQLFQSLRGNGEKERRATVTYSEDKLKEDVDALTLMQKDNMEPPVDAHLSFDGKKYVVAPETMGTTINKKVIYEVIEDAVKNTAKEVDLVEKNAYKTPKIYSDNAKLKTKISLYNKYVPFSITYTFGKDSKEVLDGNIAIEWFDIDEDDGKATLNEGKMRAWLAEFAKRHDTIGTERKFIPIKSKKKKAVTVTGGTYGWSIDEAAEFEAISKTLDKKKSETREPIYAQRAAEYAPMGEPDWGNTYIEFSIKKQHFWYVKKGKIIYQADVVTGLPTEKRHTPPGVFYILEKKRDKILRGDRLPNGKYEYETPVSYWMRVSNAGVGFHDATWQPSFGGSRYTYAGSHGCINMSYRQASELYEILEVDTPVIIY